MEIIVAGFGKVGLTASQVLTEDGHDVFVIDNRAVMIEKARDTLDCMAVKGNALSATTLAAANVAKADIFVAVTGSDEANVLACATAKRLGAKRAIARVRAPEFSDELYAIQADLGVDMIINPEQQAALEISRILRFRAASEVETFMDGNAELVSFAVLEGDDYAGSTVQEFVASGKTPVLLAAILRDGNPLIPHGLEKILVGDVVTVIGRTTDIVPFFKSIGKPYERVKDALIVGGGVIAYYLCEMLTRQNISIKLLEIDEGRCFELAQRFDKVTVTHADGTDYDVLEEENYGAFDAVISLVDRDEDNVLISLNAKAAGVQKVVCKLNYIKQSMVRSLGLTSLIYPKFIVAWQILRYARGASKARGSSMKAFYRVIDTEGGVVDALEFRAPMSAPYLNKPLKTLRIKSSALVGCISRGRDVIIASGDSMLRPGDNIVIITKNQNVARLDDIFE